jgi:hypothetical protein
MTVIGLLIILISDKCKLVKDDKVEAFSVLGRDKWDY